MQRCPCLTLPHTVMHAQVLRLLRKHGLVDGGVKRAARQQLQEISGSEGEGGGAAARGRPGHRAGSLDTEEGDAAARWWNGRTV